MNGSSCSARAGGIYVQEFGMLEVMLPMISMAILKYSESKDYCIMFMPNNMTELQDFLEQYVPKKYHYGMDQYLKNMWQESIYNFILVDFKTKDIKRRFRKGFSIIIDTEEFPLKGKK
jgi:hypothetical protein